VSRGGCAQACASCGHWRSEWPIGSSYTAITLAALFANMRGWRRQRGAALLVGVEVIGVFVAAAVLVHFLQKGPIH
jgi:hypothetical protein